MKFRYFVADFETTVYENQDSTEVWAAAISEIGYENPKIFNSIDLFFKYVFKLGGDKIIYFHNLKFDGTFILDYLIRNKWQQGFEFYYDDNGDEQCVRLDFKEMENMSFNYVISDMGQWYNIILKYRNTKIEFRDSVKLLPFSVKKIGNSFCTKYKKLEIEYIGKRHAGGKLSVKEQDYIANDVLVMDEALQYMEKQKKLGITIGSLALKEFKVKTFGKEFRKLLPNMSDFKINPQIYGYENADSYIRQAYKGGFCHIKKGMENQVIKNGFTIDVNSLYPYVMLAYPYPVGYPTFIEGENFIANLPKNSFYYVTFDCRFFLKEGYLPTVQIKNNACYKANVWQETSNIYNEKLGKYISAIVDDNGIEHPIKVKLTMSCVDFELFLKHYNVVDLKILHGCYFRTITGIFNDYIEYYRNIKENSTGALRELAKLFLNSLYGKLASSTISNYKVYHLENGILKASRIKDSSRESQYIPIGAAITSYARYYTITTAQANYDKFCYADTDSLHCVGSPSDLKEVILDKKDFGKWDLESKWKQAIFVRQKTYIEEMQDDYKEKNGKFIVKSAGMGENARKNLLNALENGNNILRDSNNNILKIMDLETCNHLENQYPMSLSEFKKGLTVEGNLKAKLIKGGTILHKTDFNIK